MLLAQEQYIFTQISHTDGFTSYVNCIYKEKNGDVLVGSPRGLFRFNGSTIKPLKDTLFVDNEVFNINIDGKGNRVAAIVYGPSSVVVVAGMNKVEDDLIVKVNGEKKFFAEVFTI